MKMDRAESVMFIALLSACSNNHKAVRQMPDGPPIGHWEKLPNGPESVTGATTVLAGDTYITWSGIRSYPTPFRFSVSANSWTTGNGSGSPAVRLGASAIWTGVEVLIWGGHDESTWRAVVDSNGAYNPVTDSWRTISSDNEPSPREWTLPVWSGKEMLVWGGADTSQDPNSPPVLGDGFAYEPETDQWRTVSPVDAPSPRRGSVTAWTGEEFLVWGGTADSRMPRDDGLSRTWLSSGAVYNPSTDTWRKISEAGAPSQGRPMVSAWSGTELLVWNSSKGEGAAYNPTTDIWRPIDGAGPLLQYGSCSVWTGKYLLVCGDSIEPFGELYDPIEDRWYLMESQLEDAGPGPWSGAEGYAYSGDAYLFGGYYGGDLPLSSLSGYRYVIDTAVSDGGS